jgi:large subunit ribosomal protein L18
MFKRRRIKKTNYRKRLALLKSRKPRLVVRKSLSNIHAQLVSYTDAGDKTSIEVISKNLKKYGWKGHCGNIPAAYLTGLLIGFKSVQKGISEAILDMGMQTPTKQNAVYALAKGANDAGLNISIGKDVIPTNDRITGKHVADFAAKLKTENTEKYKRQFSSCLNANLQPEDLPKHFEEVKNKIKQELGKK